MFVFTAFEFFMLSLTLYAVYLTIKNHRRKKRNKKRRPRQGKRRLK